YLKCSMSIMDELHATVFHIKNSRKTKKSRDRHNSEISHKVTTRLWGGIHLITLINRVHIMDCIFNREKQSAVSHIICADLFVLFYPICQQQKT
ncbi:MAG: hypothetical protein OQJ89_10200, partial [Kangiellaceae bacterium]|nr:hypothetical protein [Kangiellaceae bacterium]